MTAKKTSEIEYKILLKDICEKIDMCNTFDNLKFCTLINQRTELITLASLEYPHINWIMRANYELTELQSIANIYKINLN